MELEIVPPLPIVRVFKLTLTEQEAGVLLKVLANVGGREKFTPRGVTERLYDLLKKADVQPVGSLSSNSGLYFNGW